MIHCGIAEVEVKWSAGSCMLRSTVLHGKCSSDVTRLMAN